MLAKICLKSKATSSVVDYCGKSESSRVCIQTKIGHLTGLLSMSQYANAGGQPTNELKYIWLA